MICPFDTTNKKETIEFNEIDPYNPQNTLQGFVNRRQGQLYGSLYVTHVNGIEVPQLIYSAPKMHYPFDRNDKWIFPEFDTIGLYHKLDGTCIISFTYLDAKGNRYLSYKTRLRPFLGTGKFGNFFELWNEMRQEYKAIDELCWSPGYNFIFELYGKRNRVLILYDEPLDTKLIFVIDTTNGNILCPDYYLYKCRKTTTYFTTPCLFPDKTIDKMNPDIYNEIKDKLERELFVDEENKILKGKEGYVMYFLKDGRAVQIKNKPPSVLKYHWSGDTIHFESIYTTVVNAFENFDNPTYDNVVTLLSEEFDFDKIEKSKYRIIKVLEDVTFNKKLQYELVEKYKKLGIDINEDKGSVMRYFSTQYDKKYAQKIFTLLNAYVKKKSD